MRVGIRICIHCNLSALFNDGTATSNYVFACQKMVSVSKAEDPRGRAGKRYYAHLNLAWLKKVPFAAM